MLFRIRLIHYLIMVSGILFQLPVFKDGISVSSYESSFSV